MNAFRHAGGRDQRVEACILDSSLQIQVADAGPGLAHTPTESDHAPLGLLGLRERVEVLGGVMRSETGPGGGTLLTMLLPLTKERK